MNTESISCVLFDLDGTLADTAPDLVGTLNQLRTEQGLSRLALENYRYTVSYGSAYMITEGFSMPQNHPDFEALRLRFLEIYAKNLAQKTVLFSGISKLLTTLAKKNIAWGIVTNKPERFTLPLVEKLGLKNLAGAVISGDTCEHAKPHPEPLLTACGLLDCSAENSVYIGDHARDIEAGKAAGMKTVVAGYGYIYEDPVAWGADDIVYSVEELEKLLLLD
jgi:N-acetyl-D-muramate 6-phosphate phosphatase